MDYYVSGHHVGAATSVVQGKVFSHSNEHDLEARVRSGTTITVAFNGHKKPLKYPAPVADRILCDLAVNHPDSEVELLAMEDGDIVGIRTIHKKKKRLAFYTPGVKKSYEKKVPAFVEYDVKVFGQKIIVTQKFWGAYLKMQGRTAVDENDKERVRVLAERAAIEMQKNASRSVDLDGYVISYQSNMLTSIKKQPAKRHSEVEP